MKQTILLVFLVLLNQIHQTQQNNSCGQNPLISLYTSYIEDTFSLVLDEDETKSSLLNSAQLLGTQNFAVQEDLGYCDQFNNVDSCCTRDLIELSENIQLQFFDNFAEQRTPSGFVAQQLNEVIQECSSQDLETLLGADKYEIFSNILKTIYICQGRAIRDQMRLNRGNICGICVSPSDLNSYFSFQEGQEGNDDTFKVKLNQGQYEKYQEYMADHQECFEENKSEILVILEELKELLEDVEECDLVFKKAEKILGYQSVQDCSNDTEIFSKGCLQDSLFDFSGTFDLTNIDPNEFLQSVTDGEQNTLSIIDIIGNLDGEMFIVAGDVVLDGEGPDSELEYDSDEIIDWFNENESSGGDEGLNIFDGVDVHQLNLIDDDDNDDDSDINGGIGEIEIYDKIENIDNIDSLLLDDKTEDEQDDGESGEVKNFSRILQEIDLEQQFELQEQEGLMTFIELESTEKTLTIGGVNPNESLPSIIIETPEQQNNENKDTKDKEDDENNLVYFIIIGVLLAIVLGFFGYQKYSERLTERKISLAIDDFEKDIQDSQSNIYATTMETQGNQKTKKNSGKGRKGKKKCEVDEEDALELSLIGNSNN